MSVAWLGNAVAWGVLIGLAILAVFVVLRIGALGLLLLGLLTLFVCSQFSLHDAVPTWSVSTFRAGLARPISAEQQAAQAAERAASLSPLRFYRWCGLLMTLAGAADFLWVLMH